MRNNYGKRRKPIPWKKTYEGTFNQYIRRILQEGATNQTRKDNKA